MQSNTTTYCIIGMSPGNSYFKDDEIKYLLKTTIERYGRVAIMIADVPAISTYIGLGYPENLARRTKAIPQGNLLKNRTRRVMKELGYTEKEVRIIDWKNEVETNSDYQNYYQRIRDFYNTNTLFQNDADKTTKTVLIETKKKVSNIDSGVKIAVHYLLSEFAFMEWAPKFLGTEKALYVYHKNWPVFENFIAGVYDGVPRTSMEFMILKAPSS